MSQGALETNRKQPEGKNQGVSKTYCKKNQGVSKTSCKMEKNQGVSVDPQSVDPQSRPPECRPPDVKDIL